MRFRICIVSLFVVTGIVAVPGTAAGAVSFTEAATSEEAAGDAPLTLATSDLDGDGHEDLAVVNRASDSLTILVGNGAGDFTPAPSSPETLPHDPDDVEPGDLDNDGDTDLVVSAGSTTDQVSVLLNDGSADFAHATDSPYATGSNPNRVAVADLNGDTYADFAVAETGAAMVTVFLNDQDATFTAQPAEAATSSVLGLAANDWNLDGHIDLAAASFNTNALAVLLNDGTGDFVQPASSPETIDSVTQEIATGHLNHDQFPDLVTTDTNAHAVRVLLGDGTGNFSLAPGGPVGIGAHSLEGITVADVDGDGVGDVIASSATGTVHILTNDGTGAVSLAVNLPTAGGAFDVVSASFDGDGDPDIATANLSTDNVTIYMNTIEHGDVSITKSDSGGFVPVGENFTYTFTVKNEHPTTATGIVVTDDLPTEDVAYVSDDGGCTHNDGRLTCPVPDLDEDETHTINVVVTALEACFPLNTAHVRSDLFDDNLADNEDDEESVLIAKVSIGNRSRTEGDSGNTTFRFKVSLNSPATGGEGILYKTRLGSADGNDLVAKQGEVLFFPGEQSKTVTIRVGADNRVEPNETFFVDIVDTLGLHIEDGTGKGTIKNDDTAAPGGCPGTCT